MREAWLSSRKCRNKKSIFILILKKQDLTFFPTNGKIETMLINHSEIFETNSTSTKYPSILEMLTLLKTKVIK